MLFRSVSQSRYIQIDIYQLEDRVDELSQLEGFGTKTIQNLLSAIEASRNCSLAKFLYSLGIPNVGEGTSKRLAEVFFDLAEIQDASLSFLQGIKDIGPISATSVRQFMDGDGGFLARQLAKRCLRVTNAKEAPTIKLKDKTFVITGSFAEMDRDEIKDLIESNGGKVSGSVGKSTSYLVAGENAGTKLDKAKELNIPIIDLEQLKGMIT